MQTRKNKKDLIRNPALRRLLSVENIFVCIALLFGGLFIFVIKPLHGNDEIVHFPRAYQVQEGGIWTQHLQGYDYGGYLPVQIKQFNDNYREQVQIPQPDAAKLEEIKERYDSERLTDTRREPVAFTSAGVYAGWAYAPPAAGIFVARMLNLPLNWYVYMGRVFTLLAYVLITYLAIRFMPFGKLFLVVVALLPTALAQGGTIGMDGLVNGLSWLTISLTLAVFTRRLKISKTTLGVMAFLSLYLATTKLTYAPIAALPLLIPARLYPYEYRHVWLWRVVFGGLLGVVSLWYLGQTSPINEIIHNIQRPGLYVDEGAQLHHVFQHPLEFLTIIFTQPLPLWSAGTYAGIVGVITNRTVFIPMMVIVLLLATLLLAVFHKERSDIAKRDQLFIVSGSLAALVSTFVLINLALYLSFSRVGFYKVEGLQGRYFLPLLPLLGVILHVAMPKLFLSNVSERVVYVACSLAVFIGLASAILTLGI